MIALDEDEEINVTEALLSFTPTTRFNWPSMSIIRNMCKFAKSSKRQLDDSLIG